MSVRTRRRRLAIYKLKPPEDPSDPFASAIDAKKRADLEQVSVAVDGSDAAALFVKQPRSGLPDWVDFLEPIAPTLREALVNTAANSALLLIFADEHRYAFAFGYARSLIDPAAIVRHFGLRCALGLIEPGFVTGVRAKDVDDTTVFSEMQATQNVEFSHFRLDTEAALLRGVVGRPKDADDYYTVAAGSDALYVNPSIAATELAPLVRWVRGVEQRQAYKKRGFDWIDHVRTVEDPTELAMLEQRLDEALKKKREIAVAPPNLIDWTNLSHFEDIGLGDGRMTEITVEDLYQQGVPASKLLRKARILAMDAGGEELKRWSAYEWLTWSTRTKDDTFVLQGGAFYRVDRSFERKIDRYLKKLEGLPSAWPDWTPKDSGHTNEEWFNKELKKVIGSAATCLDKVKFSKAFRGHSNLELCDVFVSGKPCWLVCVKKYNEKSGSSSISHLFLQAVNAVEALVADEVFRTDIREKKKVLKPHIPEATPRPSDFGVSLVILTKGKRKPTPSFPFFARLSL